MSTLRRHRVRRSRHLVCHWDGDSFVIVNFAKGKSVSTDFLVVHLLSLCAEWTPVDELQRGVAEMPTDAFDGLIDGMLANGLLASDLDRVDPREEAMESWKHWNPAAGFFHFSTKDLSHPADLAAAERALHQEFVEHGAPPRTKTVPGAPIVPLAPWPMATGDFVEVLLRRRTWREFTSEPVTLAHVSTLLALTWGVQRRVESLTSGTVHLKTSPSSGARQPLEAYLLAVNVGGLESGLYHYGADAHHLELIKSGADHRTIQRYIPGQAWYEPAAALFIMTAVFGRTQWRYRFARAYRSVLLEAGHVCQTFCLVATWLGLAPGCTGRFADSVVEGDLGIDGVTESFVYGAGVGSRPSDTEWAPWPRSGTGTATSE